jgi:hypothetical protein
MDKNVSSDNFQHKELPIPSEPKKEDVSEQGLNKIPVELMDHIFSHLSDKDKLIARQADKFWDARAVHQFAGNEGANVDKEIGFFIQNLDEGKYPNEVAELKSLLNANPISKSKNLIQIGKSVNEIENSIKIQLNNISIPDLEKLLTEVEQKFDDQDNIRKLLTPLIKSVIVAQKLEKAHQEDNAFRGVTSILQDLVKNGDFDLAAEEASKQMEKLPIDVQGTIFNGVVVEIVEKLLKEDQFDRALALAHKMASVSHFGDVDDLKFVAFTKIIDHLYAKDKKDQAIEIMDSLSTGETTQLYANLAQYFIRKGK